jgi:hypothetical protein
MNHNRYLAIHYSAQTIENVALMSNGKAAGRVKGNELEAIKVEIGERVY